MPSRHGQRINCQTSSKKPAVNRNGRHLVAASLNKRSYYEQIWHGRWQVSYRHISVSYDNDT